MVRAELKMGREGREEKRREGCVSPRPKSEATLIKHKTEREREREREREGETHTMLLAHTRADTVVVSERNVT